MTFTVNGIEIEISGDAQVNFSPDGKKITIATPPSGEQKVVEKIMEKVRVIKQEPCKLNHYPPVTIYPYNPPPTTSPFYPSTDPFKITWTSSGTTTSGDKFKNVTIRNCVPGTR